MYIRRTIPKELYNEMEFYVFGENARQNRVETSPDMVHVINEYHRLFGDLCSWRKIGEDEANSTVIVRGVAEGRRTNEPLLPRPRSGDR